MGESSITLADERVQRVTSASLTDAMGRRHNHRAHILDLVSPQPNRRLFGPAITMQYIPLRADLQDSEKYSFARQFYSALGDESPADKVLVISSSGYHDTSVGGGTKLSRLHNMRMAGVVTDGRLRDFDELGEYAFATYCAGETIRWGGSELMPFAVQCPVVLFGITVLPSDYVYADASGVVVIPHDDADWILDEAMKIEAADKAFIEQIEQEDPDVVRKIGSEET